ncbi:MAG: hypothetical protein HYR56_05215 [Acidobacteria bacterium]|nr:hypothetical protein [Acidobacteriota bacterium]MBI3423632.1 hypothetical protein [Acidobacteriota bacterium]
MQTSNYKDCLFPFASKAAHGFFAAGFFLDYLFTALVGSVQAFYTKQAVLEEHKATTGWRNKKGGALCTLRLLLPIRG